MKSFIDKHILVAKASPVATKLHTELHKRQALNLSHFWSGTFCLYPITVNRRLGLYHCTRYGATKLI